MEPTGGDTVLELAGAEVEDGHDGFRIEMVSYVQKQGSYSFQSGTREASTIRSFRLLPQPGFSVASGVTGARLLSLGTSVSLPVKGGTWLAHP